jgi:3-oxoadipate enol-lactonase/4-carboxymuconolactone decarboxylase
MSNALLHHRVDGREGAPWLVLASSIGTDLHLWDAQAPLLARHFRVLRYDAPGHGRSPWHPQSLSIDDLARAVVAMLDHHRIARASIAGISLGGMTAMALARLAPERVDRLVLCCTSARLGPPSLWHERAARVRSEGMASIVEMVLGRWFTRPFAASQPQVVERIRAMLLATDPGGYAACCEAIAAMDLLPGLAEITAPTLVVAAADDPATPPAHGAAIADAIRGARLVVVEGAAHLANVERPEAVSGAMLAHLAPGAIVEPAALRLLGERIRREVLGDAHVDRAAARATPFNRPFQEYIEHAAWGAIWGRPGLDRRTRSAITLAMLVALGRDEELALHLRAARTNGLSIAEIREILLQSAVYCGVPAANHAFQVAGQALGPELDEA